MQTTLILLFGLLAQNSPPPTTTPPTIDLADALSRAKKYGTQVQSATIAAALAHEDRKQATAAALPSVNGFNQFIYTQGNGTPSGVFIGANGVHVYGEQAQIHQDLLNIYRRGDIRRTAALEAAARARVEIATRGLTATVLLDYYAIVSAARKARNAVTSLDEARRFLDITQKLEQGGEAAHSDVIKAQIQVQQRERDLQDAQVFTERAKIALAVLIFPDFQQEFNVVDDPAPTPALPPLPEVESHATANNPDLRAAQFGLEAARNEVAVARYGYLPSFNVDFFYGLEANALEASSADAPATASSTLPNAVVANRQNLGYQAIVTLNIPLWNWGATHSKVKQAQYRQQQASLDLSLTQRQLRANLAAFYREAQTSLAQVDSLRQSATLSVDSLRLTLLRYQAGEATALEVVDAQSTAALARNALEDGQLRYRAAVANLQTLTGTF